MNKCKMLSISLFLGILFVFGCDSGLNISPTGSVTEDIYWQRDSDAVTAVNAIYAELDDHLMIKQLDGVTDIGYRGPGQQDFHTISAGNIEASNNAIANVWNRYYRGIRKANDVIVNLGQIEIGNPDLLERVESEARFLRAYFYTQLASLWGSVPLILEPIGINDHVGVTDRSGIVDFVIQELDNIISAESLPISYSGSDVGRATIGAAHALKARVALRHNHWEIARDASWAVIESGTYSLFPNYGELFMYAGQSSDEIIFDRHYHPTGQTYNAFQYSASSIGGGSTVEPIHHLYLKYVLDDYEQRELNDREDAYQNLDPRWDFTVYYTGQPIGDGQIYNSTPTSPTADRVGATETTNQHGYNLKKWVDYPNDSANPGNGSINLIHIRYADVLLMYAEAKIELNDIDQSVYDAINDVRGRPSVELPPVADLTQSELRNLVRNERAVELAFEGLRLYDMNRWEIGEEKEGIVYGAHFQSSNGNVFLQSIGFNRTFNPNRDYLWPIPTFEMNTNSAITQNNPGYN